MLELIAKTETVGNEKAGIAVSVKFENDTKLCGRVQVSTEIEAVLRALKQTYRIEFLLASLAVYDEDGEK